MTNITWWDDLDFYSRLEWLEDYLQKNTNITEKVCENIYYAALNDEWYFEDLAEIFKDIKGLDAGEVYDDEQLAIFEEELEEQEANET